MMKEVSFSTWGTWTRTAAPDNAKNLPVNFAPDREVKAFMGWDGVFVCDTATNIVDMARAYAERLKLESCGQCFPCRMGSEEVSAILDRICLGRGNQSDLPRLEFLLEQIKNTARCDIGQTAPRPILDVLKHFRESFDQAISEKKPFPRGEYVSRTTAPCTNACPSHLDIPNYVEKIRFGRWDDCLEVVRRDCPLPGTIGRVCVRPCEFNCRRAQVDQPIAIRALKRYAADEELFHGAEPPLPEVTPKEAGIAIIGAGPAGLSCAYYLGMNGYRSTIYEVLDEPGGMAAVGIPDYRLPRDVLHREASLVERLGCEIRYGVNVGRDITINDMLKQGYAAVFVGVGAHESSKMRCEGEDAGYQCFVTGIEVLRQVAQGKRPLDGRKITVIGGGNVAMDCVRTALRIGFEDVNLIYRRTEAEMPADPVEIEEAKEEGVKFHYLVLPVKVLAKDGRVSGIECIRMELGEPDKSGRRRPIPVEGSNFVIETDAVVPAIGQTCVVDCVLPDECSISDWKSMNVDELTFESSKPGIFGGGDCVTGPATLIAALAAGKKAARYIMQFVEEGTCNVTDQDLIEKTISQLGVFNWKEPGPFAAQTRKLELKTLEPEVRIKSFDEVEFGPSPAEALREANRCLRCYRIAMVAV
jgi:formate dehydrogenase (NADP+) beta subunit